MMMEAAMPVVLKSMQKHPNDNHLQRNGSAAISNLCATKNFLQILVENQGVEILQTGKKKTKKQQQQQQTTNLFYCQTSET